jgi:hypothetical protein
MNEANRRMPMASPRRVVVAMLVVLSYAEIVTGTG